MDSKRESWSKQNQRAETYARLIDRLYKDAIAELIRLGYSVTFDPEKPFSFDDFPQLKARLNKLLKDLHVKTTIAIENGVTASWNASNATNDELVAEINKSFKIPKDKLDQYQDRNLNSLKVFQDRKISGMNLSDRIWLHVQGFRDELELALDVGLLEGRTSQELSQDVRKYLERPNDLFRRVRDARGQLQLSKRAKAFHPGRGVYRSSYKNAKRLSTTEINMGYRTADHERWKNFDFVVGFEQKRSNNLTKCEVCDAFVGKYPKSYHFRSVHPHCRCFAVPILASHEEMEPYYDALLDGEDFELKSKNEIKKMPSGYTDWIKANEKRLLTASKPPYFIKDNYVNGDISKGLKFTLP